MSKPDSNNFYIYQIDIGSSRGFDQQIESYILDNPENLSLRETTSSTKVDIS